MLVYQIFYFQFSRVGGLVIFFLVFNATGQGNYFTKEEELWINEHPVVQFGYKADFPPYEMLQENEYVGIISDYLQILERETGIDFQPVTSISWEETMDNLKSGKIKFVPGCAITEDRKSFLEFTSPIISDPFVIVTIDKADYIGDLSFLNNKKVALPSDFFSIEIIKENYPEIIIVERPTIADCLDDVTVGKVDAYVGNQGVVSYYINHLGYSNLKIAAPSGFDDTEFAMATTKDWIILRDISQKIIDHISTKEQNDIRAKWISVQYEYGMSRTQVLRYVYIGVGFLVAISLIFIFWARSLKKQIKKREETQLKLKESLAQQEISLKQISKQSDERKIMLQEIHHRVKNNLQIVSSLLRLQVNNSEENNIPFDPEQIINRINAISLIHEMIYSSNEMAHLNLNDYILSLVNHIIRSQAMDKSIKLTTSPGNIIIGINTMVPLAIILNELTLNSLKHGFINRNEGEIDIRVHMQNDMIHLEYQDNGIRDQQVEQDKGFGSSLIDIFTDQLDGSYTVDISHGTHYKFDFKIQKEISDNN